MKIKILYGILLIDLLTIALVLAVTFIPNNPVRIALGLLLMLFSPGYSLVSAIFPKGRGINRIESIALSIGMSIAIVSLIGLGLNFTPWGISIDTVLYSVCGFVILMSIVAITRQAIEGKNIERTAEFKLDFIKKDGSIFSKCTSLLLCLSFVAVIGVLVYAVAVPQAGEKYTEFYILGYNGEAQDYPSIFSLKNGKVVSVIYGKEEIEVVSETAKITLGVINNEQDTITYSILLNIDEEQVDLIYQGQSVSKLTPIVLSSGEKWEEEIEFSPYSPGNKEKVEFLLFKDSNHDPYRDLHFWIDVN